MSTTTDVQDWSKVPALAQRVLEFWFGKPSEAGFGQGRAAWFRKDADFDDAIRQSFLPLLARVQAGDEAVLGWRDQPLSCLALILVCDQFSRNLFRGSARSFELDPLALELAQRMVAAGWDQALLPVQRQFVYLPFEHSEVMADQDTSIRLFESLQGFEPTRDLIVWAHKHRDIIVRFGRFPHRNQMLGRESSDEEQAFLREPGSSF